jgi:hypothetical protein
MITFPPNENMVEGFLRVVKATRPKLKQYLLKKAGIASHDIRLLCRGSKPILVELALASNMNPFTPYIDFYKGRIKNAEFFIENASATSPVIMEIHFCISLPDDSALQLYHHQEVGKSVSQLKDFLESNVGPFATFNIPVLNKGVVKRIDNTAFTIDVHFGVSGDILTKLADDCSYSPPREIVDQCRDAYARLPEDLTVWVGLVLDNEELLPYQWDPESQRYKQGFYTDSTVIVP